jgi:hypothetical protein
MTFLVPFVRHSVNGVQNAGGNINLPSMAVVAGDAIYVGFSSAAVQAPTGFVVSDTLGGTYIRPVSPSNFGNGGDMQMWYKPNSAGGSCIITVQPNNNVSTTFSAVAIDIGFTSITSFDLGSTYTAGTATSGTAESKAITPSNVYDALFVLYGLHVTTTSGSPTVTYTAVTGETLVNSASGITTDIGMSTGIYQLNSVVAGSNTLSGNATFTGTGKAADYLIFAFAVLPGVSSLPTLALLGVGQ